MIMAVGSSSFAARSALPITHGLPDESRNMHSAPTTDLLQNE